MNALSSAARSGLPLRMGTARLAPVRRVTVSWTVMFGEHLLPERRQVVVDDDRRDEAGVDHLEQVVVFEVPWGFLDGDRRLALRLQPLVQRDEARVEVAVLARVDVLSGQIVDRANRRGAGTGHHHLADVRARGIGEVHDAPAVPA